MVRDAMNKSSWPFYFYGPLQILVFFGCSVLFLVTSVDLNGLVALSLAFEHADCSIWAAWRQNCEGNWLKVTSTIFPNKMPSNEHKSTELGFGVNHFEFCQHTYLSRVLFITGTIWKRPLLNSINMRAACVINLWLTIMEMFWLPDIFWMCTFWMYICRKLRTYLCQNFELFWNTYLSKASFSKSEVVWHLPMKHRRNPQRLKLNILNSVILKTVLKDLWYTSTKYHFCLKPSVRKYSGSNVQNIFWITCKQCRVKNTRPIYCLCTEYRE